jgi:NAD(P)-dependent dehydrogenase (short-subunit alcohol dehydrogenase family)
MKKTRKTILITGCSSGIGLDAALRLQSHGWLVLATCRRDADCVSLREKGLHSFVLDYADSGSIQRGWKQAMDITGGEVRCII